MESSVGRTSSPEYLQDESQKRTLTDYVGLDTLPQQIDRRILKRGFNLNLMIVGVSGLGKTTFLNTLFSTRVLETTIKQPEAYKTLEINPVTNIIEENGVRLTLTVIDTPGFGDQLNNESCCEPIVKYIKDQYSSYLRKELMPTRDRAIKDTRVHAVLYFIRPSGHSLSVIDIFFMKTLSGIVNLIPVIAKADTLTIEERENFRRRIRKEMEFHGINFYPYPDVEKYLEDDHNPSADSVFTAKVRDTIPFAVVGSERNVIINGRAVRGRRTKWGVIDIENPEHCEFVMIRKFLIRSHFDLLIQWTKNHYENYRERQLLALRESARGSSKMSIQNEEPKTPQGTRQDSQSHSVSHVNHSPTSSPVS